MTKYFLSLLIILSTLNSCSQNCGIERNDSIAESNYKMDWFAKKLTKEKLIITNDKNDIPMQVKKQLDCYENGFDIANPDENHQNGDFVEEGVPSRHLNILAKNANYLVLNYNTYNLGVSNHDIWIKYNKNGITEFWTGSTIGGLVIDSNFNINKHIKQTELDVKKINEILKNKN